MLSQSEIMQLCETYRLRPSKQFGQNYLISHAPIQAMIDHADFSNIDLVVEVGPGFGVLTFELLKTNKKVIAFEIEQKLKSYWDEIEAEHEQLTVQWGNVLHTFGDVENSLPEKYSVIANVPYQITSELIQLFLDADVPPQQIIIMVQKEVAERICAKPGDMSLLSVAVQYYGTPSIIKKVPRGNFWPSPAVDSAVLAIDNVEHKVNTKHFFKIVKAAFAHKRKKAWSNIANGLHLDKDMVKDVLEKYAGSADVRAQEVSVKEWEAIAQDIEL